MAELDHLPLGKPSCAQSIGLRRDLAQRPDTKKVSDPQHKSVQHLHHKAPVRGRTSALHTRAHTLVSHSLPHSLPHSLKCCGPRSVHTQDTTTRNSHVCAVQLFLSRVLLVQGREVSAPCGSSSCRPLRGSGFTYPGPFFSQGMDAVTAKLDCSRAHDDGLSALLLWWYSGMVVIIFFELPGTVPHHRL